jgi:hypothetical protein
VPFADAGSRLRFPQLGQAVIVLMSSRLTPWGRLRA